MNIVFIDCGTAVNRNSELLRPVADNLQCPSSSQPQNFHDSGTLSSPNYPNGYPNNADCHWRLSSSYGVSLTLGSFCAKTSSILHSDYLQLNCDRLHRFYHVTQVNSCPIIYQNQHKHFICFIHADRLLTIGCLAKPKLSLVACILRHRHSSVLSQCRQSRHGTVKKSFLLKD